MPYQAPFKSNKIYTGYRFIVYWLYVPSFANMSLTSLPSIMRLRFEPRHDKTNKVSVRPAKTQISLGIRPVWSESSLCTRWVAKDPGFLHVDSEDPDQTGRMLYSWIFTLYSYWNSQKHLLITSLENAILVLEGILPYLYEKIRIFSKFVW